MPVITVSQLNNYMKRYIERNEHLTDLWLKAEVSNFKKHYSGHLYMTLKDETSSLRAIMFKSYAEGSGFIPSEGSKVIALGKVAVYEKDGLYQFYIESLVPDGIGELYAAYEKMKLQLEQEGLFDKAHKIPIPHFPKCVGVATSISGAALRDIMNVITRRYPLCNVIIYPIKVQGIGASDSICKALDFFSGKEDCDVVILARGGGSIEDLWAFNEEKTARAIYSCKKPVISGVGHETDYTISDFVSDLRAPTPSAAAELATPSADFLKLQVTEFKKRMYFSETGLLNGLNEYINKFSCDNLSGIINLYLEKNHNILKTLCLSIINSFSRLNTDTIKKLTALSVSLEAMSPKKVLKRGYSMITDCDGKLVDTSEIKEDDILKLVFDNGYAKCNILEVNYEKGN